jgi:hypothetical protein
MSLTRMRYTLDGQMVSLNALCKAQGWPKNIVYPAMSGEHPPITTAELKAIVVRARSGCSHPRGATEGQKRFVARRIHSSLTKQA